MRRPSQASEDLDARKQFGKVLAERLFPRLSSTQAEEKADKQGEESPS